MPSETFGVRILRAKCTGAFLGSSTLSLVGIAFSMRNFNDYAIATFLRTECGRIPARGGGRLLDLGCGSRPYTRYYRERFSYCVAGDFDIRTSDLDVRLDAQLLPFADNSFDLVNAVEIGRAH